MVIDVINMRSLLNFVHGGRFFLSTHQEFVLGLLVSCTSVCQSRIRLVATRYFLCAVLGGNNTGLIRRYFLVDFFGFWLFYFWQQTGRRTRGASFQCTGWDFFVVVGMCMVLSSNIVNNRLS